MYFLNFFCNGAKIGFSGRKKTSFFLKLRHSLFPFFFHHPPNLSSKITGKTQPDSGVFSYICFPQKTRDILDRKPIIAVDGVSGSGKSTIARTLARKYGLTYIDTGAMYRALTYYAMQKRYLQEGEFFKNLLIADLNKIQIGFDPQGHTLLDGQDVETEIRSMDVSQNVSLVSSVPEVRQAMVLLQRSISRQNGIAMDGRDIGTVVFPDADVKLFIVSDPRVRARRRCDELKAKGVEVDFEQVLDNITSRDYMDTHRETSPLVKAPDAIEIDNSSLTLAQQEQEIDRIVAEKLKNC